MNKKKTDRGAPIRKRATSAAKRSNASGRKRASPAATRASASVPGDATASVAAFYAHAIAIETEAAERYHELAAQMRAFGNHDAADLFERLARFEAEHAARLKKRAAGMRLPKLPQGAWEWLKAGPTEVPKYEFLFRRVYTLHVLLLALQAERRAQEFFERIGATSAVPAVRRLAAEFAREEAQHALWVEQMLEAEEKKPIPEPASV